MRVLVVHDGVTILAWLVGEEAGAATENIRNGYPELLMAWETGELTATEIEVPSGEKYRPDLFEVSGGVVNRKGSGGL